MLHMFLFSSVV